MRSNLPFILVAGFFVILTAFLGAAFTVDQTEQALVLRFGEPVVGR